MKKEESPLLDPKKTVKRFFWNDNYEKFAEYTDGTISPVLKKSQMNPKIKKFVLDKKDE